MRWRSDLEGVPRQLVDGKWGAEAHRRYLEEQMLDLQVHDPQDILDRDLHGNKQEKDFMCGMRRVLSQMRQN